MKVVIAVDSFKGSLSSMEAGNSVKKGIKRVYEDADIVIKPLADGGEGTVEALTSGLDGKFVNVEVTGPLGKRIASKYGILKDNTAVIEMSEAAGITLVSDSERNPLNTTTYGVGEIIKDAILRGCRNFIVGIGGSATNDGGIGMLQALGYSIYDIDGNEVPFGARGLEKIYGISDENVIKELKECKFNVACDVNNPLYGKNGASFVFGPQKGATPEMVADMDKWMENYACISKKYNEKSDAYIPGTGAAGGLGFAFLTYTDSVLRSGIEIVLKETGIEDSIKDADIVITGEGKLDSQTGMGKAPIGIAQIAKKYNKKVIAFSGIIGDGADELNTKGIDSFFPIIRKVDTLDNVMNKVNAKKNMEDTVEQVFRIIKIFE